MKSPINCLKSKLKNAKANNNLNNNLNLDANYVSNLLNSLRPSLSQNLNKIEEHENIFIDKEISIISNFKFLNNNKYLNCPSKYSSSTLKNTNIKVQNSYCSSSINSNNKDILSSRENVKTKKQKYLQINNPNKNLHYMNVSKTPKANGNYLMLQNNEKDKKKVRDSLFLNYAKEYKMPPKFKDSETINKNISNTNIQQYDYYNNIEKVYKINENIQKELESMELKKKVNLMKKTIIQINNSQDLEKILTADEKVGKLKKSDIQKSKYNILDTSDISRKEFEEKTDICYKEKNFDNKNERYRKLERIKEIFDSFDDEEYEDENEGEYYISPTSYFIKIFDCIMFLSCMFYLVVIPHYFSKNIILKGENKFSLVVMTVIDLIYILDIIINFFRAYHNFDENLVRKPKDIFIHYIKTWFLFDFIQAIPFFSFFKYLERDCINFNICSLEGFAFNKVNQNLYLIILIKIVKVYKMLKYNNTISSFGEFLSQNEFIDNYGYIAFSIIYSLCFLNISSCLYIFIGSNSFPGWIMKFNLRDEPYINIYVASLYFIVVTITTVGYGDITGNSFMEIIFQMLLLIIGTLAYSFVISYLSNFIFKHNQKSLAFEKNLNILKEIKRNNPNLKDSIYKECIKNLLNEQLYERKDKSLLFDCLPYSLKNKLIMEMYKPFIQNFVIFKYVENSHFIVKVVTSLKPLLSFKGNILIQEGDFIKEIFFVKKGVLSLNITIDRENIEDSLKKYLDINEVGGIKISYMPELILNNCPTLNWDDDINNYLTNKKKENKLNIQNNINIQDIKIIEIRKNEHFGDALMFLNERSPLVVKVKTKIAELLILRKMEAIEIYSIYPNIWKKINKKALFNMEQIKLKIKKEIFAIAKKYGSEAERNILRNSKSLNRFMSLKSFKENSIISQGKNNKKRKIKKNQNKYDSMKIQIIEDNCKINKTKNKEKEQNENISNEQKEIITSEKKNNNKKLSSKSNNINNEIIKSKEKSLAKEIQIKLDNKLEIENEKKTNSENNESKNKFYNKSSSDSFSSNNYNSNEKIEKSNNKKEVEYEDIEYDKIKKKPIKYSSIPLNFNDNHSQSSNKQNKSTICLKRNKNSLMTKSEYLYYPYFTNLSTTNEKSFELMSSYENLNKITKNIYMNNSFLQAKTKQFLINECSSLSNDSPKSKHKFSKNQAYGKASIKKNLKNILDCLKNEDDNKSVNSLDLSKLQSNRNYEKLNDSQNKDKKIEIKNRRHESTQNLIKKSQSKINLNAIEMLNKNKNNVRSNKKRRKSDVPALNKKLNMITKNIKGANKNINNPEEFYIDFFNNIIKQETGGLNKIENKKNSSNNKINDNSPGKKINFSEKNSPNHRKFNNTNISVDDFKFKKSKISRKISKLNFQFQS